MRKTAVKLLAFMSLALVAQPSLAAGAWTPWTTVHMVYTYTNKHLFVQLTPNTSHIDPDGCSVSKSYYQVAPDVTNRDEMYQMLLTAKAANLKVSAYISGCNGNYPRLLHLRMTH